MGKSCGFFSNSQFWTQLQVFVTILYVNFTIDFDPQRLCTLCWWSESNHSSHLQLTWLWLLGFHLHLALVLDYFLISISFFPRLFSKLRLITFFQFIERLNCSHVTPINATEFLRYIQVNLYLPYARNYRPQLLFKNEFLGLEVSS